MPWISNNNINICSRINNNLQFFTCNTSAASFWVTTSSSILLHQLPPLLFSFAFWSCSRRFAVVVIFITLHWVLITFNLEQNSWLIKQPALDNICCTLSLCWLLTMLGAVFISTSARMFPFATSLLPWSLTILWHRYVVLLSIPHTSWLDKALSNCHWFDLVENVSRNWQNWSPIIICWWVSSGQHFWCTISGKQRLSCFMDFNYTLMLKSKFDFHSKINLVTR